MLEIVGLKKAFGRLEVLKGIDLSVRRNGIFAILGPNGSGKTTLIKSVLGLVIPDDGDIRLNGKSVIGEWKYRNDVNYLPQIADFPSNLKVDELFGMIKNLRPKDANDTPLIEAFGLEPFMQKRLGHLSGGTKQKVNIALTFMFDSELIILDEPTAGLDPISLIHLKELIRAEKERGKTILITSHIMSFVEEITDEIVFLLEGVIHFEGPVEKLKSETGSPRCPAACVPIEGKTSSWIVDGLARPKSPFGRAQPVTTSTTRIAHAIFVKKPCRDRISCRNNAGLPEPSASTIRISAS